MDLKKHHCNDCDLDFYSNGFFDSCPNCQKHIYFFKK